MARKSKTTEEPQDRQQLAQQAASNKRTLGKYVRLLSEGSRRERQQAASIVHIVATDAPQRVLEFADDIAEALNRPEAQTRWEALRALTPLVQEGYKPKKAAFEAICDAIYDENSGIVREAAFTFLCTYGASGKANAAKAWPHIDEAIQCYHGNDEFNGMLTSLVVFAQENKSKEVAGELAKRMTFDAQNAKGTLKMRSVQIVKICQGKK